MASFKVLNIVHVLTTSLSCEDQLLLSSCLVYNKWNWNVVSLHTNKIFNEVWVLLLHLQLALGRRCTISYPVWALVLLFRHLSEGLSVYCSVNTRILCCKVRKVWPLLNAITFYKAKLWATGVRKLQSELRDAACIIQYDSKFNCIKLNPVLIWRASDLTRLMISRLVEYNCMLSSGYKSVGCAPCTRAVRLWERARTGRWWWERLCPSSGECGLHTS
ncbi:MAG: phosphoadenosine phosphosulfate reductase family protein [Candidatus Hodgkinia cicadicola]